MTVLPIVDRELRVGSRRRGTYWSRVAAAGAASVVATLVLLATMEDPPQNAGQTLFYWMAGITMISAASSLRVTADCLSEEKREGTLGLLFLTDLKGYDVVFGKLVANSLGSLYGILAVFPVLAISILLGGVTYGEFWRVLLTTLNLLFLSSSAGLLASAICRDERKAISVASMCILLLAIAGPVAGFFPIKHSGWRYNEAFLITSPAYACFGSLEPLFRAKADRFWLSSLFTFSYGCLFLWLACRIVPRSWQEKGRSVSAQQSLKRITEGAAETRVRFRRELLDMNPFYWLASRDRLKTRLVWLALALLGAGWIWGLCEFNDDWLSPPVYVLTAVVLHLLLKLWLASESCRRFIEDRRSGAMELLLSTPVTVDDIFKGQRLALLRQFGAPVGIVVLADIILMFAGLKEVHSDQDIWFAVWIAGITVFIMDLFTLSWVGMWTGASMNKANRASGAAIGRVLVLPWVAFGSVFFFYALLMTSPLLRPVLQQIHWPEITAPILWFWVAVANNVFWTRFTRHRLRTQFRTIATQRFGTPASIWKRLFSRGSSDAG